MKILIKGYDSTEIIDLKTNFFSRLRNGELFVKGSDTWICTGFLIVNNFGFGIKTLPPSEFYAVFKKNKEDLFYKNGKAKFRVLDLDHGTSRIWSRVIKKHEISIE